MDEYIKELDADLDYLEHEITADEVILYVASNRKSCRCPYCGHTSMRIHSRYEKSFQDLPIMGKKTKVIIENRKLFCDNPDCTFTTFAERFDFLEQNGKKTKRLIDKIIDISLNTSSVAASRTLKDGIAEVGKSTICNLLKKRDTAPWKAFHNKSVYWWFRIPEKTDLWHYHGGHWYTPCGRPACIPWGGRCGGMA